MNKEAFCNVHINIIKYVDEMNRIQGIMNESSYKNSLDKEEKKALSTLNHTFHLQDQFWRDTTKKKWFKECDMNTSSFHILNKMRYTTNNITRLKNDSHYIYIIDDIEKKFMVFYKIFSLLEIIVPLQTWLIDISSNT